MTYKKYRGNLYPIVFLGKNMSNSDYIYSESETLRTTLDSIVYLNTTLPPSLKIRGALALVKSQELVAGEWVSGRRLFGVVTKLNDSEQVSNILSRGRSLEACKEEIDKFLAFPD